MESLNMMEKGDQCWHSSNDTVGSAPCQPLGYLL